MIEAATVCPRGCNRRWWRLQPCVSQREHLRRLAQGLLCDHVDLAADAAVAVAVAGREGGGEGSHPRVVRRAELPGHVWLQPVRMRLQPNSKRLQSGHMVTACAHMVTACVHIRLQPSGGRGCLDSPSRLARITLKPPGRFGRPYCSAQGSPTSITTKLQPGVRRGEWVVRSAWCLVLGAWCVVRGG